MTTHDRYLRALRECEESHSEDERKETMRHLYSHGYQGGMVFPGIMGFILEQVSPMKMDESLRRNGLRGYGEDIQ